MLFPSRMVRRPATILSGSGLPSVAKTISDIPACVPSHSSASLKERGEKAKRRQETGGRSASDADRPPFRVREEGTLHPVPSLAGGVRCRQSQRLDQVRTKRLNAGRRRGSSCVHLRGLEPAGGRTQ